MKTRMAFGAIEEGWERYRKQQAAALARGRLLVIVATICLSNVTIKSYPFMRKLAN